jgi:hypothetical protein
MNKRIIAIGLAAIGIIFYFAGMYQILADNISNFGGIVFLMLSGLTWAFWPNK